MNPYSQGVSINGGLGQGADRAAPPPSRQSPSHTGMPGQGGHTITKLLMRSPPLWKSSSDEWGQHPVRGVRVSGCGEGEVVSFYWNNGKAERFIKTLLEEWAYMMPYGNPLARNELLPA